MKMIVCVSENYGIGYRNKLLFSIAEDMKFFRSETHGKVVVMGRSTLDSFPGGRALKNRVNIVLTRNKDFSRENTTVVHDYDEAMNEIRKYSSDSVYIIGGCEIYRLFANDCDEALVTKVKAQPEADKFFFDIDNSSSWKKVSESETKSNGDVEFTFNKYLRY